MSAKERCFGSLFREFCGLKAGLRKAVIAPASWVEQIRQIIRALDIRPAPLFFSIPYEKGPIDVVICSRDYEKIGKLGGELFFSGTIEVGGDFILGERCGYPSCCIEAFADSKQIDKAYVRYRKQCNSLLLDPFSLTLYEDEEGWIWVFSHPSLPISHIPCSPKCAETRRLARRYYDLCSLCRTLLCKKTSGGI